MKLLSQLLDIVFPRLCVGCGIPGEYICQGCRKELIPHPDLCPFCHRVMVYGQTCYDCFPLHKAVSGIMVAFVYTTLIKKLILNLKFFHKYDCVWFLAHRLSLLIQTNPSFGWAKQKGMLYVTFVPSHRRRRLMIKWYNQSELLARAVANQLNIPVVQAVKKQKYTSSQINRTREERLTNLVWAFSEHTSSSIWLPEGATLLIIDDITTTGATIHEVAKTWKNIYPACIIWWVVVWRHGK